MARNKETRESDVLTRWKNGGRLTAVQKASGGEIEVSFSNEEKLALKITRGILPMTDSEAWAKLAAVRSDISRREFRELCFSDLSLKSACTHFPPSEVWRLVRGCEGRNAAFLERMQARGLGA